MILLRRTTLLGMVGLIKSIDAIIVFLLHAGNKTMRIILNSLGHADNQLDCWRVLCGPRKDFPVSISQLHWSTSCKYIRSQLTGHDMFPCMTTVSWRIIACSRFRALTYRLQLILALFLEIPGKKNYWSCLLCPSTTFSLLVVNSWTSWSQGQIENNRRRWRTNCSIKKPDYRSWIFSRSPIILSPV